MDELSNELQNNPEFIARYRRPNPIEPPEFRCIETIAPKENWVVKIGTKKMNLNYLLKNDLWCRTRAKFRLADGILLMDKPCPANTLEDVVFYEFVDAEPLTYFSLMQEQCYLDSKLLYGFAENLSGRSVEVICKRIFQKIGVLDEFIDMFYRLFFPAYLKLHYNWFSLSLLVRASVAFPERFKILVQDIMRDTDVPSTVLQDYLATLDTEKKSELMIVVSRNNLNNVQFCHNLKFICALFTEADKNDEIYNYILVHLEFHSYYCSFNKDYGRLLVAFMSNLASFHVRHKILRKLIDTHGSSYKAVCVSIMDDLVAELLHLQYQLRVPRPRFYIPREPVPSML